MFTEWTASEWTDSTNATRSIGQFGRDKESVTGLFGIRRSSRSSARTKSSAYSNGDRCTTASSWTGISTNRTISTCTTTTRLSTISMADEPTWSYVPTVSRQWVYKSKFIFHYLCHFPKKKRKTYLHPLSLNLCSDRIQNTLHSLILKRSKIPRQNLPQFVIIWPMNCSASECHSFCHTWRSNIFGVCQIIFIISSYVCRCVSSFFLCCCCRLVIDSCECNLLSSHLIFFFIRKWCAEKATINAHTTNQHYIYIYIETDRHSDWKREREREIEGEKWEWTKRVWTFNKRHEGKNCA